MQRQIGHLSSATQRNSELSRFGTVSRSSAASAITVVYVHWLPTAVAVTTVARTVS